MPSGKKSRQQRQQATTPPPVRSKGGPGGARKASGRTLVIAGVVILVVIVAIVLGIVLTNNSSGGTNDGSSHSATVGLATGTPATGNAATSQLQQATFVDKTLKGIPQNGLVLGNPNAPVTLTEYIDLQCPVCRDFVTTQVPTLVDKYVRPGKLKINMQPWNILDAAHPQFVDSLRGQKLTIGASDQNKAFNYTDVLYWNQGPEGTGWLNDAMASNIAASVTGLNTQQLIEDANSAATTNTIKQIDSYAQAHFVPNAQFSGTPTIFLNKSSDPLKFYTVGLPSLANLEAAIDADLK